MTATKPIVVFTSKPYGNTRVVLSHDVDDVRLVTVELCGFDATGAPSWTTANGDSQEYILKAAVISLCERLGLEPMPIEEDPPLKDNQQGEEPPCPDQPSTPATSVP